jgi:hypothetical protein
VSFDPIGALRAQVEAQPLTMAQWGYRRLEAVGEHDLLLLPPVGDALHLACLHCGALWHFPWDEETVGRTHDEWVAEMRAAVEAGREPDESYPLGGAA